MSKAPVVKISVDLRYLCKDRDRHGNVRYYFRRNGKKTRIRAVPSSGEFRIIYDALIGRGNTAEGHGRRRGRAQVLPRRGDSADPVRGTDLRDRDCRTLVLARIRSRF